MFQQKRPFFRRNIEVFIYRVLPALYTDLVPAFNKFLTGPYIGRKTYRLKTGLELLLNWLLRVDFLGG
jgi:hypothetical protein